MLCNLIYYEACPEGFLGITDLNKENNCISIVYRENWMSCDAWGYETILW